MEAQREKFVNEATVELSRCEEQVQHLRVDVQLQQMQAASRASDHQQVGSCPITRMLEYGASRKRTIQRLLCSCNVRTRQLLKMFLACAT